jgi:hypothetical protein
MLMFVAAVTVFAQQDMSGKLGIGAGDRGVGVRYWIDNKLGLDAELGFTFGDNTSMIALTPKLLYTLRQTNNLRFMLLGGINLISNYSKTSSGGREEETTITNTSINGGIGLEYSFTELPEITFGAFATGISIETNSTKVVVTSVRTTTDSNTSFGTNPAIGLNIRYYFK